MTRLIPPQLGEFSRDEEEVKKQTSLKQARDERARDVETDHLCLRCMHAPVCGIWSAAKLLGAEGDLIISMCGVFQAEAPTLADLMAQAEAEGETDEHV